MTEINLETLNALIEKGKELKALLNETPEILEYLRLTDKLNGEKNILPIVSDRLIRAGEAAEVLGVNSQTIGRYAREGILTPFKVDGSNQNKFWLSEVKAIAKKAV